jgi:hypothetical protein
MYRTVVVVVLVVLGNGIYYALPLTVLTVEVPVTKLTLVPGRCLCQDKELMRSKGELILKVMDLKTKKHPGIAPCKDLSFNDSSYVYYKLGDISISSYVAPDSTKLYYVQTRKNVFRKNTVSFVLNELGVLNSAEVKVEDRTLDVVTQLVGSVAEVAGKFMKAADTPETDDLDCKKLRAELDLLIAARNVQQAAAGNRQRSYKNVFFNNTGQQRLRVGREGLRQSIACPHICGQTNDIQLFLMQNKLACQECVYQMSGGVSYFKNQLLGTWLRELFEKRSNVDLWPCEFSLASMDRHLIGAFLEKMQLVRQTIVPLFIPNFSPNCK